MSIGNINICLHVTIDGPVDVMVRPAPIAKAILHRGGAMPAGPITVDTTTGKVTISFQDDKGNAADAPAGAVAAFTSSDPTIATIAADPADTLAGDIGPVAVGSFSITAALTGALEADGVTPIPDPAPLALSVVAGPAALALEVESV